jgi:hypothetical protein
MKNFLRARTQILLVSLIVGFSASQTVRIVKASSPELAKADIAIGGTAGFDEFADPGKTCRLRATHRVRLYIHDYIWTRSSKQTDQNILKVFEGTGPHVVEIGATRDPDKFWNYYYKDKYLSCGVKADQAHVNGVGRLSAHQWNMFVAGGKAAGLKVIAPVFAPNSGQWKNAPFKDAKWNIIRAEAISGRGLTVDSPPNIFLSAEPGYREFIEEEIRWAKSKNLQSTFIISPNVSGKDFRKDTIELIKKLEADHALPDFYVVENYRPLPIDPNYLNWIGDEKNPISINGVALWLAKHAPRH